MQTIKRENFILFLFKGKNNDSEKLAHKKILTYQDAASMPLKENYSEIY